MYWYIKYPLILIVVLAMLGIGSSIFRSCVKKSQKMPAENGEVQQPSAGEGEKMPGTGQVKMTGNIPNGAAALDSGEAARIEMQLRTAQAQLDGGSLVAARRLAQLVLDCQGVVEFDHFWQRAVDIINIVNKRIMNSTAPSPEKKRYCVVRGDTLRKIAANHFINIGSLMRINECIRRDDGRDPVVVPSMTLMYIEGTWSIRVSKTHYALLLYLDGQLYRCYKVGIGKEDRTPLGHFLITSQTTNPSWTPPGRPPVPFGDPQNVLGTRWMKLTPDASAGTDVSLEGYGIHGTPDPDSVGTGSSMGCVRMRNEEVEELYDFIPVAGGSTPAVKVLIEE